MSGITRGWCETCGQNTAAELKPVSHLLHFVLTIVTGGLWLPFWIAAVALRGANCRTCGGPVYSSKLARSFDRAASYGVWVFAGLFVLFIFTAYFYGSSMQARYKARQNAAARP